MISKLEKQQEKIKANNFKYSNLMTTSVAKKIATLMETNFKVLEDDSLSAKVEILYGTSAGGRVNFLYKKKEFATLEIFPESSRLHLSHFDHLDFGPELTDKLSKISLINDLVMKSGQKIMNSIQEIKDQGYEYYEKHHMNDISKQIEELKKQAESLAFDHALKHGFESAKEFPMKINKWNPTNVKSIKVIRYTDKSVWVKADGQDYKIPFLSFRFTFENFYKNNKDYSAPLLNKVMLQGKLKNIA